jgi:hypothetical protein
MQCFEKKQSENIKREEAARDFSDKYDFALLSNKYPIKFMKLFIISLKRLIKLLILFAYKKI